MMTFCVLVTFKRYQDIRTTPPRMLPPDLVAEVLHAAPHQDHGVAHPAGVRVVQDPNLHFG